MSFHPRKILPPGNGVTRKRKEREREGLYSVNPSIPSQTSAQAAYSKPNEPTMSNQLLAGYMAYEFLTKGTLLGQKFDPARAESTPIQGYSAEPKRNKTEVGEPSGKKEQQSYAEVASILKTNGAHVPGIFNPTQLAGWIKR